MVLFVVFIFLLFSVVAVENASCVVASSDGAVYFCLILLLLLICVVARDGAVFVCVCGVCFFFRWCRCWWQCCRACQAEALSFVVFKAGDRRKTEDVKLTGSGTAAFRVLLMLPG